MKLPQEQNEVAGTPGASSSIPTKTIGLDARLWSQRPVNEPQSSGFRRWWWLAVLFLTVLSLFLLYRRPMSVDEGIWSYMGWRWDDHGELPYRDTIENKTPGIFLLHAAAFHVFDTSYMPVRVLGLIASLGTALLLYTITTRWMGCWAGLAAMVLQGLAQLWYRVDGWRLGHTEVFMMLFVVLSVFCLQPLFKSLSLRAHLLWSLLAGVSLGTAISFKQIAVVDIPAMLIFYLAAGHYTRSQRSRLILGMLTAAGGMGAMLLVTALPLIWQGLEPGTYLQQAWGILFAPQASSNVDLFDRVRSFFVAFTRNKMVILIAIIPLFLLGRTLIKTLSPSLPFVAILTWTACDFLGVNASGYYYRHQIKQWIPSLCLIGGVVIGVIAHWVRLQRPPRRDILGAALLFVCLLTPFESILGPIRDRIIHLKDPAVSVVQAIRERSRADEPVLVWGRSGGNFHVRARRKAPSRYFNDIFLRPRCPDRFQQEVIATPPALILIAHEGTIERNAPIPPWFQRLLEQEYRYSRTVFVYDFYERRNHSIDSDADRDEQNSDTPDTNDTAPL